MDETGKDSDALRTTRVNTNTTITTQACTYTHAHNILVILHLCILEFSVRRDRFVSFRIDSEWVITPQ